MEANKGMYSLVGDELTDESGEVVLHTSYAEEKAVLECVRDGDLGKLETTWRSLPDVVYGRMSGSTSKNLFYGSIANTTLVTRYAIEGGMPEEEAFSLSDYYIRKMEQCRDNEELNLINEEMASDFTLKVHEAKATAASGNFSPAVSYALDYIYAHRKEQIRLEGMRTGTGMSPKYLSHIFAKETGSTISKEIRRVKIECAMHLLRFSDYSCNQISQYLAFNSQSHFAEVFRKETGMTPGEYRRKVR